MGKRNAGFSLIETLVSIVILGAMVVPTCTALVMSIRLNDKTEKMLQAQLAVSSAVETLMAEGFDGSEDYATRFPDVVILEKELVDNAYYNLTIADIGTTVTLEDNTTQTTYLVTVKTSIRAANTTPAPSQDNGGGG